MRLLASSLLALLLCTCVPAKKYKTSVATYTGQLNQRDARIDLQNDSINNLILALERSRGGNDMLLETQDRLQDRLALQDDEIEQLSGNFSSTSTQLNRQMAELREAKQKTDATLDTVIGAQRKTIADYSDGLRKAANVISDSLERKLPTNRFSVEDRPGEVILSVQEDILFRPRSVETFTEDTKAVLRAVTDALQANPLLKLHIVGHTDNQPNPRRGTDNWEYGALRATALAKELALTYYLSPNRMVASSQGEFSPLQSNATDEGRNRNRRVDFVLTSSVSNLLRELDKVAGIRE